jgi:hypothetical protein
MGDEPIISSLSLQDNTGQNFVYIYQCLKRDSNSQSETLRAAAAVIGRNLYSHVGQTKECETSVTCSMHGKTNNIIKRLSDYTRVLD